MKKIFRALLVSIIFLAFGIRGIQAQDWSWEDPVPISPLKLVEIAADPTTGTVFGVDTDGSITSIDLTSRVTGSSSTLIESVEAKDTAVGLHGEVYLCTETKIKSYNPSTGTSQELQRQPLLPADGIGKYTKITAGRGGNLIVLYEATPGGNQYLLSGNRPPVTEGVVIRITPRSLNLNGRSNWVTCSIDLPEGTHELDIDPNTVRVVNISVPSLSINADVDIPRAFNSPLRITSVRGKEVLAVNLPRYDKNQPTNPQSLAGKLREILRGYPNGYYRVILTVEVVHSPTGEKFTGTDDIRVKFRN